MSKFTIGSQWKDACGRKCIIVNIEEDRMWVWKKYPAGAYETILMTLDGKSALSNARDLIEPWKEPVVHEGWVNFYPDYISEDFHVSHRIADDMSGTDRIACIKIKFTEGEGL